MENMTAYWPDPELHAPIGQKRPGLIELFRWLICTELSFEIEHTGRVMTLPILPIAFNGLTNVSAFPFLLMDATELALADHQLADCRLDPAAWSGSTTSTTSSKNKVYGIL